MSSEHANKLRKVVAIGDIHGDYFRILRILEEQQILIPGTLVWNPLSDNVDLVFIGDYIDWRGESLEGYTEDWASGGYKVLWFLKTLWENIDRIQKVSSSFSSKIHIVMGNHDDMMMESVRIFSSLSFEDVEFLIENPQSYTVIVQKYMHKPELAQSIAEQILRFLNWFVQGGEPTIDSFGGLRKWKDAMEGSLGKFLRKNLILGIIINGRLYSHSVPDKKEFWTPFRKFEKVECGIRSSFKEAFLWGRKIWGYDFSTGMRAKPFTSEELDEILKKIGIKGFVVGHTPMNRVSPLIAYEGRVVNIDLHGVPGSQPYVEIYFP